MGRINFILGVMFIVALLSHLLLDIFNKKPVHLINFIPKYKKGICFRVVNSDNPIVNMVITGISITISLFLLILMTKK